MFVTAVCVFHGLTIVLSCRLSLMSIVSVCVGLLFLFVSCSCSLCVRLHMSLGALSRQKNAKGNLWGIGTNGEVLGQRGLDEDQGREAEKRLNATDSRIRPTRRFRGCLSHPIESNWRVSHSNHPVKVIDTLVPLVGLVWSSALLFLFPQLRLSDSISSFVSLKPLTVIRRVYLHGVAEVAFD